MVTVAIEGAHGAFEIVQAKTLFPKPNPVTLVPGESELVMTPVPDTNVQAPVPTRGKFAFITATGDEIQTV